MRSYTIDLPDHLLHFSLPEEIARGMSPLQVESRFRPDEPGYLKDGFRVLGSQLHDFNGPFWVGAYGSLKFTFDVLKRGPGYQKEIATLPGLDSYVRWWIGATKNAGDFTYARGMVNGTEWVARLQDTFGNPPTREEPNAVDVVIYSHPLGPDMFLEAGFRITEWVPGSAKKWKTKAETFREAIKATIVLEPKKK